MRKADILDTLSLVIGLVCAGVGYWDLWRLPNPDAINALGNGLMVAPVVRGFMIVIDNAD